jgi:hypothetical protein
MDIQKILKNLMNFGKIFEYRMDAEMMRENQTKF